MLESCYKFKQDSDLFKIIEAIMGYQRNNIGCCDVLDHPRISGVKIYGSTAVTSKRSMIFDPGVKCVW